MKDNQDGDQWKSGGEDEDLAPQDAHVAGSSPNPVHQDEESNADDTRSA